MKTVLLISFLVTPLILSAQSVFSLSPSDTSLCVQIQDPSEMLIEYSLDTDIKNLTGDTLEIIWRKEIPPECPSEWKVQISDPNISYLPSVFSNYDSQTNTGVPITIPPNEWSVNGFYFNLFPFSTLGSCTMPVHFSLLSSPDSILATAYFEFSIQEEDCLTVNIVEAENTNIRIFPNPATGIFNVKTVSPINAVTVYNLQGVLLASIMYDQSQLDLSNLPNGVYFLKIKLSDGKQTWQKIEKI